MKLEACTGRWCRPVAIQWMPWTLFRRVIMAMIFLLGQQDRCQDGEITFRFLKGLFKTQAYSWVNRVVYDFMP